VRTVIPEDIEKTYSVREAFELVAVRHAAKTADNATIHQLKENLQQAGSRCWKTTLPDSATWTWSFTASSGTASIIRCNAGWRTHRRPDPLAGGNNGSRARALSAAPSRNTTKFTWPSGTASQRGNKPHENASS